MINSEKIISIGTYQVHGGFEDILLDAWRKGSKYVDTAPNYRSGKVHYEIHKALERAIQENVIEDFDEINISTKIGFVSPHDKETLIQQKVIFPDDTYHNHNISLDYIKYQMKRNYDDLRTKEQEILFLHNPESQINIKSKEEILDQIREAFIYFEEMVDQKKIKQYGISTWTGLEETNDLSLFSVREFYNLALEIKGENHHFSAVQLPISMVKVQPLTLAILYKRGPLIEAVERGIDIHVSSPLHGGQLPKMRIQQLCQFIDEDLSFAQCALLFSKSHSSIRRVLTSPSSLSNLHEALYVEKIKDLDEDKLSKLIVMLS